MNKKIRHKKTTPKKTTNVYLIQKENFLLKINIFLNKDKIDKNIIKLVEIKNNNSK